MKKSVKYFSLFLLVLVANSINGQIVIYSEDFDPSPVWPSTPIGVNGADPNFFQITDDEGGVAPPGCGVASNGNQTLHLTSQIFPGGGAAYDAGGLCPFICPQTATRAESPNISTIGHTNLTLNFDYIHGGDASDFGGVWYNDGGGWVALVNPLPQTPGGCLPQGQWTNFSIALPASCDNIANLQIGFSWVNNDDGVGTDPSISINDVEITKPSVAGPTAAFMTTGATSICEGTCIDFMDMSTVGAGPYVYAWTFTGGTPGVSAVQNPVGICYNTAGTYAVSFTVTDGTGTDNQTTAGYITVVAPPDAGADVAQNLCNNTTLDLDGILSGADPGGVWTETSGTPSGQFTPGTGVLDGNGLTPGNIYTFNYTVAPTAPCVGSNVATMTITIQNCTPGSITASFTPSSTNICVGDCITFVEASFGAGIIGWGWQFTNGTPATALTQNPGSVCFNVAGAQDVTLTVTDGTIFDDTTITITVNALPTVTANANPGTTICTGDPVTLSGGGATSYTWDNGVTNGVSFTPASTLTYTVTGTDGNSCQNTATVTITLTACIPMVAGFTYIDNICVGDCITLQDTTTGTPTSWAWDFGGGATPNTSTAQNPVVCFDAIGTFNIQLTTTDAGANSSSTTNSISIFGLPSVIATLDTVIDIGGSADLMANGSGPGSYWWSPADGNIDDDTSATTFASPEIDTEFIVTFSDVNGCEMKDTVFVYVNFIEGIGVPQAFSPNDDGNNDILFVKGFGIETMKFVIYNRYGEKVFETSDQNIGWDGTFKNRDENPGVFVWVLEYTFLNGNGGLIHGNTTLVR